MATQPESTKISLRQRLRARAKERWRQPVVLHVRYHGVFAYVTGELEEGTRLPLCRLRYGGSATTWGFAIYRASRGDYENSILPNGLRAGTRPKYSTVPAASTSTTPPPGNPRRINGRTH